jgi:hypothetical protein
MWVRRAAFTASFALAGALFFACAYVLPAAWRAFHADPDDAAPAITRALDTRNLQIAKVDQAGHKIVTGWASSKMGSARSRERYVITWERDAKEATLTIYVRNEAQDQELDSTGVMRWGAVYHNGDRENTMLDLIAKELSRSGVPPPPVTAEGASDKGSN